MVGMVMETGKFYKQRGFWPFVTFWGGMFFAAYMVFAFIWITANLYLDYGVGSISIYLTNIFAFVAFVASGVGLAGAFPRIRIVDNGVEFQYLRVLGGIILWEEIEWLYTSKSGEIYGLSIQRKGSSPLMPKGLYFHQFYGRFVGKFGTPCLLLSTNMENFEAIIQEIKGRIKPSLTTKDK